MTLPERRVVERREGRWLVISPAWTAGTGSLLGGSAPSCPRPVTVSTVVVDRHADEAFSSRGPFTMVRAAVPCHQSFTGRAWMATEQGH